MKNTLNKQIVLFIAAVSSVITSFMSSAINIALPSIQKQFSMDAISLNWVAAAYLLATAIFLVPFGRLADIYGRRRLFFLGLIAYAIATLLCSFSISSEMLILSRVFQGIGGALIIGTNTAILTSVFEPGERGKAIGINIGVTYIGLSMGPVLGGLLTQHIGWRSIFLITIPLCVLDIILVLRVLKTEWSEAKGERFDLVGSVLYGIALAAVIYGFSLLPSFWSTGLITAGILLMLLFVLYEAGADFPVLNIMQFKRNKVFIFSSLTAFLNYSAVFAAGFLLSLYLQNIKGLSPSYSGLILLIQPALQAIFSPFAGRLSDRLEPSIVAAAGMALISFGLFLLIFLGFDTAMPQIITSLVLIGFGIALFTSPNTSAIMGSVEKRFYGLASGIVGTMRLTGQVISMGITMVVFAMVMGRTQLTSELYQPFLNSLKTIFVINALLCFVGIFTSIGRGRMHIKEEEKIDK